MILLSNSCQQLHAVNKRLLTEPNLANSHTRGRCYFKGLSQHLGRSNFSKISAPHSLTTTYQMNLISAGSILLDGILKSYHQFFLF